MPYFEALRADRAGARRTVRHPGDRGPLRPDHAPRQYLAFSPRPITTSAHGALLMACGSRLPESNGWLRAAIRQYIAEEAGHEDGSLNDIAPRAATAHRARRPLPPRPS